MDEAFMLGRGKYLDRFGYEESIDIFSKHLKKVIEISQKYGIKVKMWGDVFYSENNNELLNFVKSNDIDVIYWDYGSSGSVLEGTGHRAKDCPALARSSAEKSTRGISSAGTQPSSEKSGRL